VTTDARVIRAGRYAEIGTTIRRDATILIDRWAKRAVQEQPTAKRVHHEVLLDELPTFLWELGGGLAEAGHAGSPPHCRLAHLHAEQRWENGWSLAEVVRDYRILRLVVLEYLDECLDRPLRLVEVQAVGLALDEAIEVSVERYVRNREVQLGSLEEAVRKQGDALREADRRRNEFLATLAHELRNPLAPLRNAVEVVRLGGDSPSAVRQVRELMDRQVHQMTRLVEDLLDVSRIAQGKLVLRKCPLDLRPVLEQAVQMNAPLLEARGHRLSVFLPAEPLCVEADQARLVQVFVNLLNNAAKFSPEPGQITLSAAREGEEAVVRVKDRGTGIAAEMLPHIFELFTQIDIGPERPQGGLGIGLALVRRLVELHGGAIAAASPGVGRGSEFVVRLPAAAATSQTAGPAATPGPPPTGRHILIVEDNQDGRESLALLLGMLGHCVDVAEDGRRGVEAALSLRPEVALIDIGLPGLDGYEVASRVRAGLGQGVLLVALTGHSQPEDRRRAAEAGFNAHLTKPNGPRRVVRPAGVRRGLPRPGRGRLTTTPPVGGRFPNSPGAGLQSEKELELRPGRGAAVHAAQVQAGGHLAGLVPHVGPDPRRTAVVHDDGSRPVQPARPIAHPGPDRPDAEPLVDQRAASAVKNLAMPEGLRRRRSHAGEPPAGAVDGPPPQVALRDGTGLGPTVQLLQVRPSHPRQVFQAQSRPLPGPQVNLGSGVRWSRCRRNIRDALGPDDGRGRRQDHDAEHDGSGRIVCRSAQGRVPPRPLAAPGDGASRRPGCPIPHCEYISGNIDPAGWKT
jgi:signal transduction histidine kinase/CheY-like chemotaxis protein